MAFGRHSTLCPPNESKVFGGDQQEAGTCDSADHAIFCLSTSGSNNARAIAFSLPSSPSAQAGNRLRQETDSTALCVGMSRYSSPNGPPARRPKVSTPGDRLERRMAVKVPLRGTYVSPALESAMVEAPYTVPTPEGHEDGTPITAQPYLRALSGEPLGETDRSVLRSGRLAHDTGSAAVAILPEIRRGWLGYGSGTMPLMPGVD